VEKTSFLAACFHVLKAELSKGACMGWAGLRPWPGSGWGLAGPALVVGWAACQEESWATC
jgi:hypothetical protein